MKHLAAGIVAIVLLGGAAKPTVLTASSGGLRFELRVGSPDAAYGPGPGVSPGGGPGMGGPGMGGPGMGGPGMGGPGMGGPGPRGRGGPGMGGPGGMGPGPGMGGMGEMDGPGPMALMDGGPPTHGIALRVRGPGGKPAEVGVARVVAVRKSAFDVMVSIIPPYSGLGSFAGNLSLPGRGAYKFVVRVLDPAGKPVTAKFDYTY